MRTPIVPQSEESTQNHQEAFLLTVRVLSALDKTPLRHTMRLLLPGSPPP